MSETATTLLDALDAALDARFPEGDDGVLQAARQLGYLEGVIAVNFPGVAMRIIAMIHGDVESDAP